MSNTISFDDSNNNEWENPAGRDFELDDETRRRWGHIANEVRRTLDGIEKDLLEKKFLVGRMLQTETLMGAGGYGQRLLQTVSEASGESVESLRLARHVARVYEDRGWAEARTRRMANRRLVPWSVHAEICAKCSDAEEALEWLGQAARENWSRQAAREALRELREAEDEGLHAQANPAAASDHPSGATPKDAGGGANGQRDDSDNDSELGQWKLAIGCLVILSECKIAPPCAVVSLVDDLCNHLDAKLQAWGHHGS